MITRRFDNNIKVKPSLLGFGCMRLPQIFPDKADIDYKAAEEMVDFAYKQGVNYFDTAYVYHEGKSEQFVGHALKKYPRESFYLADKMPGWEVKEKDDVHKIFTTQLKRCQVDYFDFYLCHSLSEQNFKVYDKFNIFDILNEKKKNGQIRYLGFSFHDTPDVLESIINKHPWDFVQIQLNYLDWERQDAKRQYEIIEAKGIPCIIMEPVRGGTLANLCEVSNQVLKNYDKKHSVASWAIRYAASLPNVMTVLSGMSDLEQVEDNVETMNNFTPLSSKEYEIINTAKDIYMAKTTIPCTGCRYCMDCPSGVDIPGMFHLYNEYLIGKFVPGYRDGYNALGDKSAKSCVGCQKCMEHCPQKIDIAGKMKEICNISAVL